MNVRKGIKEKRDSFNKWRKSKFSKKENTIEPAEESRPRSSSSSSFQHDEIYEDLSQYIPTDKYERTEKEEKIIAKINKLFISFDLFVEHSGEQQLKHMAKSIVNIMRELVHAAKESQEFRQMDDVKLAHTRLTNGFNKIEAKLMYLEEIKSDPIYDVPQESDYDIPQNALNGEEENIYTSLQEAQNASEIYATVSHEPKGDPNRIYAELDISKKMQDQWDSAKENLSSEDNREEDRVVYESIKPR